jgi:hypothetical protein
MRAGVRVEARQGQGKGVKEVRSADATERDASARDRNSSLHRRSSTTTMARCNASLFKWIIVLTQAYRSRPAHRDLGMRPLVGGREGSRLRAKGGASS